MKSIFFILILFFTLSFSVNSQTLIFEDSTGLNRGIYKNFSEFKFNKPSILEDFEIKPINFTYFTGGTSTDSSVHIGYALVLQNKSLTNDSIWGFCDGKNVYVNTNGRIYKPKYAFEKLEYMGRYCYFTRWSSGTIGTIPMLIGASIRGTALPHLYRSLININNGITYYIDNSLMKKVLSRDKLIYSQYKQEEGKNREVYFKYLKLYSEAHKEEIKR